jgi:hypothetical protein
LVACDALLGDKPPVDIPFVDMAESPTPVTNQSWVIVTKEQAEEIASWLGGSSGFWTPSVDDIIKLEEKIAEYLSQNPSQFYSQPPVWERLDEYQCQYIGLERGGRRIIYGNYFCENGGINWHQKLVIVEDGGDCYFQVEYDVERDLFIKLLVNGVS